MENYEDDSAIMYQAQCEQQEREAWQEWQNQTPQSAPLTDFDIELSELPF